MTQGRPSGVGERGAAPRRRRPARGRGRVLAREFDVGKAFSSTFRVLGRVFVPFLLLSMVVQTPFSLWQISAAQDIVGAGDPSSRETSWDNYGTLVSAMTVLSSIAGLVVQAAVVFAAFQVLQHGRANFLESVKQGFTRFLPVLGASILVSLIMGAALFVPGVLAAVLSTWASMAGTVISLFAGLALILYLSILFFVAVPAAVVERGVYRALARSAWLTAGARWKILMLCIITLGIPAVLGAVYASVAPAGPNGEGLIAQICVQDGVQVLMTVLGGVLACAVYYQLRREKEGVGLEQLLEVFK